MRTTFAVREPLLKSTFGIHLQLSTDLLTPSTKLFLSVSAMPTKYVSEDREKDTTTQPILLGCHAPMLIWVDVINAAWANRGPYPGSRTMTVGSRRPEGTVSTGENKLDTIETYSIDGSSGRVSIPLDVSLDFIKGQRPREI
jgi:hypothetical protein